jgi:hypothetical protein
LDIFNLHFSSKTFFFSPIAFIAELLLLGENDSSSEQQHKTATVAA